MIRRSSLALLVLAAVASLATCAPIDIPPPPVGGPTASAGDDTAASRREAEQRQRRLARKRDKACEKHPDRCD
jgi:hypothetical protein